MLRMGPSSCSDAILPQPPGANDASSPSADSAPGSPSFSKRLSLLYQVAGLLFRLTKALFLVDFPWDRQASTVD